MWVLVVSLISLSSALEPLRIANLQSGQLYSWGLIGSGPSHETSAMAWFPGLQPGSDACLRLVIVVGGVAIEQNLPRPLLASCAAAKRDGHGLGLYRRLRPGHAGLLDGYQCSAHWDFDDSD